MQYRLLLLPLLLSGCGGGESSAVNTSTTSTSTTTTTGTGTGTPINTAPTLTLSSTHISLFSHSNTELTVSATDAEQQPVQLSVQTSDSNISASLADGKLRLTSNLVTDTHPCTVQVTASDGSLTSSVQLTVQLQAGTLANLQLPSTVANYQVTLPVHLTNNAFPPGAGGQAAASALDNTPSDNPISNNGATLGRVLFYDRNLSKHQQTSCASCHQQTVGFSDSAVHSTGDAGTTRRHSMSLVNARFYQPGTFFWDERAASLEQQVLMPIQDSTEMGLTLAELVQRVESLPYYAPLFTAAFGDNVISSDRISKALAQFVRSMVSTNSRYDSARALVATPQDNFPSFTAEENLGKSLFFRRTAERTNCSGCHVSEAFVSPSFPPNAPAGLTSSIQVNGLDAVSTDDLGVAEATGNARDIGKFKAPSLRNIALTAPYMHDGRFATLAQVIDHYSTGIQPHVNLSNALKDGNGQPLQSQFSNAEKQALLAFLATLTDNSLSQDSKFSDPFVR